MIKIIPCTREEFINQIANWLPWSIDKDSTLAGIRPPKKLSTLFLKLQQSNMIFFNWIITDEIKKFRATDRKERIIFERSLQAEDIGTINREALEEITGQKIK